VDRPADWRVREVCEVNKHQCPRCGHQMPHDDVPPGAFPGALSRYDNRTYICSECGADEAVRQIFASRGGPLDRSAWFDQTGVEPEGIRRYTVKGFPKD